MNLRLLLQIIIATVIVAGCSDNGTSVDTNNPDHTTHKNILENMDDYAGLQGGRNELKFTLPISGKNAISALSESCYFQNTVKYPLHLQFLHTIKELETLSVSEYENMSLSVNRSLWAGELLLNNSTIHPLSGEKGIILFIITTDENSDALQASADEIILIDKTLKECMPWASSMLVYTTISSIQNRNLSRISDALDNAGVAWIREGDVVYEQDSTIYSIGENYGYLKIFKEGEAVSDTGRFDVVLSERATNDLSLLAGIVTHLPQTYLSHLNIRLREKSVPSAHVSEVLDNQVFNELDGKLVHISTHNHEVVITPANLSDAQQFWENNRPDVGQLAFDLSQNAMRGFDVLRHNNAKAYGTKAVNLGELYQALGAEDAVHGFGIPFYWYDTFMKASGMDLKVNSLLDDPVIYQDSNYRRSELKKLRKDIREQQLPVDFLDELKTKLNEVFGQDAETTRIRFRSSTNAEDLLNFSGAGLYDSKSGCLADYEDADNEGPSHCLHLDEKEFLESELATRQQEFSDNPERYWLEDIIKDITKDLTREKSLDEAVLKVWASLWTERAFDEREYYGLDHRKAFMGIAVNKSFVMESKEAVAISNDTSIDESDVRQLYRINSQLGNIGVVKSDDPLAVAEQMTFRRGTSFNHEDHKIITRSSLSTDADLWSGIQLDELASLLFKAHDYFANNVYSRIDSPKFDIEIEVIKDTSGNDKVYLKQLRPYLSTESYTPNQNSKIDWSHCPTSDSYVGQDEWRTTLFVNNNVELCRFANRGQTLDQALAQKSRIKIVAGTYKLPSIATSSNLYIPACLQESKNISNSLLAPQIKTGNLFSKNIEVQSYHTVGNEGLLLRFNHPPNIAQINLSDITQDYPSGVYVDYPSQGYNYATRFGGFRQCNYYPNESYKITVQDAGELIVDHKLWRGTTSAGFVAPMRIKGNWQGKQIDINNYEQMTATYGQHAFEANLHIMFDEPINGEYGIKIERYVNMFGFNPTVAWSLDANGNQQTQLQTVTSIRQ